MDGPPFVASVFTVDPHTAAGSPPLRASVVIDEQPVELDAAAAVAFADDSFSDYLSNGCSNRSSADDVLLMLQQTYPSTLGPARQAIHLACIGIGCPLNALVACVMFRQRRLRNPRNTFWLGTVVCNLLALANAVVEYAAFVSQDPIACFVFSSSAGMPYTLLLVNLLLATVDRWLALTRPLYHRENVTVSVVVAVQLISLGAVMTCWMVPFWLGAVERPRCAVNSIFLEWISVCYVLLTLLTIATQIAIYMKARSCLRRSSGLSHRAVHHQHRINRLEVEATVTLVVGVASLCIFSLPFSLSTVANAACRRRADMLQLGWCDPLRSAMTHCRELFIVHAVYNPVMFMIRSKEFSSALRSIIADTCSVQSE